jgi:hypothetical protein
MVCRLGYFSGGKNQKSGAGEKKISPSSIIPHRGFKELFWDNLIPILRPLQWLIDRYTIITGFMGQKSIMTKIIIKNYSLSRSGFFDKTKSQTV